MANSGKGIKTTISPWLSVTNAQDAVNFYKKAFGAVETYRLETPDGGLVSRLSVDGAEFWLSGEAASRSNVVTPSLGGDNVRMILVVSNPETFFNRALEAGATLIFPIGEEHGWRLGRLADPFGLHWEIGYQLSDK
jgi:PhnB protein